MMDIESVSELDFHSDFMWLIVQEDVMSFGHHKSLKYYRINLVLQFGDCLVMLVTSHLQHFSSEKNFT
jgi:hypothetical protein